MFFCSKLVEGEGKRGGIVAHKYFPLSALSLSLFQKISPAMFNQKSERERGTSGGGSEKERERERE